MLACSISLSDTTPDTEFTPLELLDFVRIAFGSAAVQRAAT